MRPPGPRARGPGVGHDPAEGRLRPARRPPRAFGGDRRRRSLPGPVRTECPETRDGRADGRAADHLRPRKPQSGDRPRRGARSCTRRDHRDRAIGFSQSGQQRPVLSLHLPRCARRRCDHDKRRDGDRLHRRHREARAPDDERRGRGRISGRTANLRAGLPYSQALRPATDGRGGERCGQGGDGDGCGGETARRSRRIQAQA